MLDDDNGWEPGPVFDEDETDYVLAPPAADTQTSAHDSPKPVYSDLESWLRMHLSQVIRRRFGGSLTWCSQWYRHGEAVSRLNAMWQEWEKAVVEDTMSTWWLYHCDPHLNMLMSKDSGPFMACKPDEHRQLEPLPLADSDPDLWLGTAFSDPRDPAPDAGTDAAVAASRTASSPG